MAKTRRQLTLFVPYNETIEEIRATFNAEQYHLIAAHVTLCREDEIEEIDKVTANIKSIKLKYPILIELIEPKRFDDGKGVFIPAKTNNHFNELRKVVLKGVIDSPRQQLAHITLMHPRNSVCTDAIFNRIKAYKLPISLSFDTISLIEQVNDEPWSIVEQFQIVR